MSMSPRNASLTCALACVLVPDRFPPCEVVADSAEVQAMQAACLSAYPSLNALRGLVQSKPSLAGWLDARPKLAHDNVMTMPDK